MAEPAQRWTEIEAIFEHAVSLVEDERDAFLDRVCATPELRREVESLLAADHSAGSFLDHPLTVDEPLDDARIGTSVGLYRILRRLGRGGMATVFVAVRDRDFDKEVAVKIFGHDPARRDLLRRFAHERQILAGLEHPHIARLLDGGSTDDGLPYLVMELVDGAPIDRFCDRERLSIDDRIRLFIRLCEAVSYAHRRLVVHRDLKPRNILVTPDGTPKLLDFGIAKLLAEQDEAGEGAITGSAFRTAAGQRLMTPAYASPEQVLGQPVTTSSDVYALGVLLYRLLTGGLPYRVEGVEAFQKAIVEGDTTEPSAAVRELPDDERSKVAANRRIAPTRLPRQLSGDLDAIVLRALRKDPTERYDSVTALADDLSRHLDRQPIAARTKTPGYVVGTVLRRYPRTSFAALLALVLILGFAIFSAVLAQQVSVERDEVLAERDRAEQAKAFLEEMFAVSDPAQGNREISRLELLDHGAARLDAELTDQPELYASLAATLSGFYVKVGLTDRAAPLLDRALELNADLPVEHPMIAELHFFKGVVAEHRGEHEAAEAWLRPLLDIRRPAGGVDYANTLNQLGVVLLDLGRLDEAEAMIVESMAIRREIMGDVAPDIAVSLNNISFIRLHRGDLVGAAEQLHEALRIIQAQAGEPLETLIIHNNLGWIHTELGDLAAAEASYSEVTHLAGERVADGYWKVFLGTAGLGTVAAERGDRATAEALLDEALAGQIQALGDDHPRVADVLQRQGRMALGFGDVDLALAKLQEAGEIFENRLGPDHPYSAGNHRWLGRAWLAMGDTTRAEHHFRTSLERWRARYDDSHYEVGKSLAGLGATLIAQGDPEAAEPLLRQAIQAMETTLPPTAPLVVQAQDELAELEAARDR